MDEQLHMEVEKEIQGLWFIVDDRPVINTLFCNLYINNFRAVYERAFLYVDFLQQGAGCTKV